jgi:hypothetical protein
VAALTAVIDSREQADWLASLRLDPPEEERADVRHAVLLEMLTALLGNKRVPAQQFLDDLPWRETPPAPPPASPATLRRKIDAVMTMLGGKR